MSLRGNSQTWRYLSYTILGKNLITITTRKTFIHSHAMRNTRVATCIYLAYHRPSLRSVDVVLRSSEAVSLTSSKLFEVPGEGNIFLFRLLCLFLFSLAELSDMHSSSRALRFSIIWSSSATLDGGIRSPPTSMPSSPSRSPSDSLPETCHSAIHDSTSKRRSFEAKLKIRGHIV